MWRAWVYTSLSGSAAVTTLVPAGRIYASGALSGRPAAPFITLAFGPDLPEMYGDGVDRLTSVAVDISCHDDQGGYKRIDTVLDAVKAVLMAAAVPANGYPARPLGRSGDMADDVLDTLKKYETFQLIRRLA